MIDQKYTMYIGDRARGTEKERKGDFSLSD